MQMRSRRSACGADLRDHIAALDHRAVAHAEPRRVSVQRYDPAAVVEELRKEKLPNLWIPKTEDFVKLDRLPLLGSGKLDLAKLKKLAEEQASA